jgi:hypothetical protein
MPDETNQDQNLVKRPHTLTRNNLEFAGLVTYFFALAVLFCITLAVMLFQNGAETKVRPWQDHQPALMASVAMHT